MQNEENRRGDGRSTHDIQQRQLSTAVLVFCLAPSSEECSFCVIVSSGWTLGPPLQTSSRSGRQKTACRPPHNPGLSDSPTRKTPTKEFVPRRGLPPPRRRAPCLCHSHRPWASQQQHCQVSSCSTGASTPRTHKEHSLLRSFRINTAPYCPLYRQCCSGWHSSCTSSTAAEAADRIGAGRGPCLAG